MNTPNNRRPGWLKYLTNGLGLLVALVLVVAGGLIDQTRTGHPDAAAGAACPVEPDESVTSTVRIAWQGVPNGDLVVKDRNWLESCLPKARINWVKMGSGGDVLQAFGARSIDLAQVGSSPTVKGVSAPLDLNLQIVWLHDVIGTAESLVAKDPAITSLAGLKGRTVASPFGSTSHFSLMQALRSVGIDSDVKVINLAPDAMMGAWQRGEIDAAWVWEPTLASLLAADGHPVMSSADTATAGAPTFDLAAGTREFVEANPDFMRMWTTLQQRATTMINEQPDDAAASLAVQLGISTQEARRQLAGYSYPTASEQMGEPYFGGQLPTVLQQTATFLKGQQSIDAVAPASRYAAVPNATWIKELS